MAVHCKAMQFSIRCWDTVGSTPSSVGLTQKSWCCLVGIAASGREKALIMLSDVSDTALF